LGEGEVDQVAELRRDGLQGVAVGRHSCAGMLLLIWAVFW
jgi:hypothetical protein